MELADKLKSQRERQHLSQEEVANKIKVSRQTISNWETGKTMPDIHSIILISELYDVSLDSMLKGDNHYLDKIEKDQQEFMQLQKMVHLLKIIGIGCFVLAFFYLAGHAIGKGLFYLKH